MSSVEIVANVLNSYFKSVFTAEDASAIPLEIKAPVLYLILMIFPFLLLGLQNSLNSLNLRNPQDQIKFLLGFLKTYPCAAILKRIFEQTYDSPCLPEDWKRAVVTPIFKKGDKSLPKNYCFISLTSISFKVMEHIVLSSTSKSFFNNDIITPYQHGFRKGFSTVTKLISILDDWFSSLDKRTKIDVLRLTLQKFLIVFLIRGYCRISPLLWCPKYSLGMN